MLSFVDGDLCWFQDKRWTLLLTQQPTSSTFLCIAVYDHQNDDRLSSMSVLTGWQVRNNDCDDFVWPSPARRRNTHTSVFCHQVSSQMTRQRVITEWHTACKWMRQDAFGVGNGDYKVTVVDSGWSSMHGVHSWWNCLFYPGNFWIIWALENM